MKQLFLLAGAAAFAVAAPAIAAPGGAHGGGGAGGHAMMAAHGPSMHANMHATAVHGASMHANAHATTHASHAHGMTHATHAHATHATTHVRNAHATTHATRGISTHDQALAHKYGGALCPPGLYKKTPACIPPGQAKRLFHTGQRVPVNYKYITPYSDIPQALITQYNLTDQYRYIYRNNVIYVIDPTTNLITRIINAVL